MKYCCILKHENKLSERSQEQQTTSYDSICVKCQEKTSSDRKQERGCFVLEVAAGINVNGPEATFWGVGHVLKLDGGNCCTIL